MNYNGPAGNYDFGKKVLNDPSGNVYIVSGCNALYENYDIVLFKYDTDGNEIWKRSYSNFIGSNDYPTDMSFDNLGNLIVIGNSSAPNDMDIVILKYDTSGNDIWQRRYNNTGNTNDYSYSMHVDNAGNIYITGYSYIGSADLLTLKYDSNGNLIFNRYYDGTTHGNENGNSVTTDNFGNVYVAGYTSLSFSDRDYITLKYGPGGNLIWGRIHVGIQNDFDIAYFIKADNYGNIIVSGNTSKPNYLFDVTTIKYDPDGNIIWERTYAHSVNSRNNFVNAELDESNNIYLYINSNDLNLYEDFDVIVKYNENGDQVFVSNNIRPISGFSFKNSNFTLDKLNNIFISYSHDFYIDSTLIEKRIYLLKLDPQGTLVFNSFKSIFERDNIKVSSISVDNSGNTFITGEAKWLTAGTGIDVMNLKFDANGNNNWVKYYIGEGDGPDIPNAMIKDKNENIYITGSSIYGFYTSFITLKYRADGSLIWKNLFKKRTNAVERAIDIAQDPEGNVFVTGFTTVSGNNTDILTVKYDSNGVELWFKEFAGAANGEDKPSRLVTDNAGNIYITGTTTGSGSGNDILTLKYDANGNLLWSSVYNGTSNSSEKGNDLILDDQNNVYVTGFSTQPSSGSDGVTIKYDQSGNQQWVKFYSGTANSADLFKKIKSDEDHNIYVSGEATSNTSSVDFITVKYNTDGDVLWERIYNGTANSLDRINDMTLSDNFLYVTGESIGTGTSLDFVTIKYDLSGNEIWQSRFNGAENRVDVPRAITSDSLGNVYITGQSFSSTTNNDFLTIKYDYSGNLKWNILYNGTANNNDNPVSILLNKNGEVFVTGVARNLITSDDIVTIKYSQTVGIQNITISIPETFKLYNNYPNPFNPQTKIKFDLPVNSDIQLKIYDITGREVHRLFEGNLPAGSFEYLWNASNYASGVYFYKLTSETVIGGKEFSVTKRMVLLK